jgi:hypothetical protein
MEKKFTRDHTGGRKEEKEGNDETPDTHRIHLREQRQGSGVAPVHQREGQHVRPPLCERGQLQEGEHSLDTLGMSAHNETCMYSLINDHQKQERCNVKITTVPSKL